MSKWNKAIFGLAALAFGAAALAQSPADRRMSLQEALETAIERNLDIELQRINMDVNSISLDLTRAQYEPQVTSTASTSTSDTEATIGTEGQAGSVITTDNLTFNSTLSKQEDFGLGWRIAFNNNQRDSNSLFSLGETYSSSVTFSFQQELLQGFAFDSEVLRNDQYVAITNLDISEYDLETQMTAVLQQAENAYWDLVLATEKLAVANQSLELAKQLYEQNRVKIEVGTLAPIELVNTEATIATREQEVVAAENAQRAAEDTLKKVLNLPAEEWSQSIKPTDPLRIKELDFDFQRDLETAWRNRPEMRKIDRQIDSAMLTQKLRRNQLKPQLSLNGSYTVSGASSPAPILDEFDDPVLDENGNPIIDPSSYDDAIRKIYGFDLPGWSLSLNLTWNPLNKTAKLNMARANIDLRQRQVQLEQTKVNIMEEVRAADRELESNLKAIAASEKALKFRQENLKAELQKFQNGLSTNYRVAEEQRELAASESALLEAKVNYLKAVVSYYKALGDLMEQRKINMR